MWVMIVAYAGIQTRTRDNIRMSELCKAENGSYPLPTGAVNW